MTQYVGIRNQFRPSALVPKPYGWTSAPTYNRSDVPSAWVDRPSNLTSEQVAQQLAYEWLDSHQIKESYSNPPFTSGAAGRLHPSLTDKAGSPHRILRGFIRRSQHEAGDTTSFARLYFMYNPEAIVRDYVSYLDQAALDPFNTVYGSGNLVAPPSFMNFRFDLFFDRQTEAQDMRHPGVFVDYQFFDLVVRNVVPTDPNQTNNTFPDNGVMMVNPRDITVVFSPQLTVQGRPLNAQVVFEKFTHRMTPIRMRISLEMRVMYVGPLLEQTAYSMQQAEFTSEVSVPTEGSEFNFNLTFNDVILSTIPGYTGPQQVTDSMGAQSGITSGSNSSIRMAALNYARSHVNPNAFYSQKPTLRMNLPNSSDCSGLVYSSYKGIGQAEAVFGGNSNCASMMSYFNSTRWRTAQKVAHWNLGSIPSNIKSLLQPGDLLYKIAGGGNHVAFFTGWEGDRAGLFDSAGNSANPSIGARTRSIPNLGTTFNYIVRPLPVGHNMSGSYARAA